MIGPKPHVLVFGRTEGGENIPVRVDEDGVVETSGAGGGGGDGAITDGADSAIKASVLDGSVRNPVAVVHTDADGNVLDNPDVNLDILAGQQLDYDTGAGTDAQVVFGIALPASGGAVAGGTSTNPVRTDPTGTTTQPVNATAVVPGTGATNLGKAEDGAHTSGDVGTFALGVRVDTPNAAVAADGDYHYIAVNALGAVRIAPPEQDFAVVGSKHVKKYYTNAGAVTDGIIWSPAAGTRWYITSIFLNVSADCTVTLEDDKAAGDEAIWKAELKAGSGWATTFPVPWFSGEDAADLTITTTAGNIYVTVVGYEI